MVEATRPPLHPPQPLPPLDEAASFAALIRKGTSLDELAAKTGLSAGTIRRRLVLCDLCDEAKAALTEGIITLAIAEALTLGDHNAQRDVLDDLARGYGPYSADDIRAHLLDDRPTVAMAIFPVEEYTGTITTDLFAESETSYFDDAESFMALQRQAVEKLAADYAGKADWVEVTDAYRIPHWQYEQAEDGETGGVLINLAPSGKVEIREGLARPQIEAATRAATADHPAAPKKPKAAYSTPLCRYIAWHKSVAVQELLLADSRKAKEVLAVRLIANLAPHEGIQHLAKAEEQGSAYRAMEAQARLFAGWLGFAPEDDAPLWTNFPPLPLDVLSVYEAVRGLADHELEQLVTLLSALSFGQNICERLDSGDTLFNRVARDLSCDMRNHWQPDRAFLERRTREQLIAIAKASGYADGVSGIGSFKKGELVAALLRHFSNALAAAEPSPAQVKAREWLPGAMQFPAVDPDDAAAGAAEDVGEDA